MDIKRAIFVGGTIMTMGIVAVLAADALPYYRNARLRDQASTVLGEARTLDSARDLYAVETRAKPTDAIAWESLKPYIEKGSRLSESGGRDIFGNPYAFSPLNKPVAVSERTVSELSPVVPRVFWGSRGLIEMTENR